MKKLTKRLIALVLVLCMTTGFTTLCFAKDNEEAGKLSNLIWELVCPGEHEDYHNLLHFYLPEGYRPGNPDAEITFNSPTGSRTKTMSEFDVQMIDNESETKVLYTICLPSDFKPTGIVFSEGAFIYPDGTPTPAFATEKRYFADCISFSSLSGEKIKAYEGMTFDFSIPTVTPLFSDSISVKCTDESGQSIPCEIEISYSEQSMSTSVTFPLKLGLCKYELYYNDKLLSFGAVNALTVEEYTKKYQETHATSVLSGIGIIPLLPIYILAGAIQYAVLAPCILFIPFLWAYLPLLPVAPVIGFGGGMFFGVKGWIADMQYFFAGKENNSNIPVPTIRNFFLVG